MHITIDFIKLHTRMAHGRQGKQKSSFDAHPSPLDQLQPHTHQFLQELGLVGKKTPVPAAMSDAETAASPKTAPAWMSAKMPTLIWTPSSIHRREG